MSKQWDESMKRALLKAYAETISDLAEETDVSDPSRATALLLYAQAWMVALRRVFDGQKETGRPREGEGAGS